MKLTEELLNKKISDLTVNEFILLFPKIGRSSDLKKLREVNFDDKIIELADGRTIYSIAKELKGKYERVYGMVMKLEREGKVILNKNKNSDKRTVMNVFRVVK